MPNINGSVNNSDIINSLQDLLKNPNNEFNQALASLVTQPETQPTDTTSGSDFIEITDYVVTTDYVITTDTTTDYVITTDTTTDYVVSTDFGTDIGTDYVTSTDYVITTDISTDYTITTDFGTDVAVPTDLGTDTSSTNIITTDVFETNLVDNALDYEVWAASWAPPTADAISVVPMILTTPFFNHDPVDPTEGQTTISEIEFARTKQISDSVPQGRKVLLPAFWHSSLPTEPIWQSIAHQTYYADETRDGISVNTDKSIQSPWMDIELQDIKLSLGSFIDKCDAQNVKFDYVSDDAESWGRFSIWSLYVPQSDEPCIGCGSTVDHSSVAMSKVGMFQCITTKTGTVHCWWDKDYANSNSFPDQGQCDVPASLPPCKQVACGYGHTLALTVDGKLIAWGADGSGQGKKGTEAIQDQITAAGRTVTKIDCGASHNVALLDDGQVVVWGANEGAQLSDPDTYWTKKDDLNFGGIGYPGGYHIQSNEVFKYHQEYSPWYSCVSGNCNRVHRCADATEIAANQRDSASGCESPYRSAAQKILDGETPFLDWQGNEIPGGRLKSSGLNNNGWETVTGAPYDYQFSRATTGDEESPNFSNSGWIRNPSDEKSALGFSPKTYVDVKAGRTHVIALADDGTIDVWGANFYYAITGSGKHGWDGRTPCIYGACLAPSTWSSTNCSNCFSRAGSGNPRDTAIVRASWGHNTSVGVKNAKLNLNSVRHIGTSYYNCAIILENPMTTGSRNLDEGDVFVWDRNEYGESFQETQPIGPFKQITGGYHHFVALRENGSVVAWGENDKGQCDVPAQIANPVSVLDEVVWVGAGRRSCLARTKSGKLIGWGDMRELGGQAKLDTLSLPQTGGTTSCWSYQNRHCSGVYLSDENALELFVSDPRFQSKLLSVFATSEFPEGRSVSDVFFERYSGLMLQAGLVPTTSSFDALSPLFGVAPNVVPWASISNKCATRAWNGVIGDMCLGYYRAKMWEDVLQEKGWTDTQLSQYAFFPLSVEQSEYFEDYNGGNWSEPRQSLNNWLVSPWFYGYLGQLEQSAAYVLNPITDDEKYLYTKIPQGSPLPQGVVRYSDPVWLTFLNEMRQLRAIMNSSPTAWERFVPWITGPLTGHQAPDPSNHESYYKYFYDQRYWKEIVLHLILHGTKFFNYWETYGYKTGGCVAGDVNQPWCTHETQYRQSTQLHNLLEEWRLQSGNSRAEPVVLDKIPVNTNIIVSGGKLLKSGLYLWRISVAPNSGNFLQTVGTSESRTDIPAVIEIPSTERGVWLLTISSQAPQYVVRSSIQQPGTSDLVNLTEVQPIATSKNWLLTAYYGANPSATDPNPYGLLGKAVDYLSNANIYYNYQIYEGHEIYGYAYFHTPDLNTLPIIVKTSPSTTIQITNSPCAAGEPNYSTPHLGHTWFIEQMHTHGAWGPPMRENRPFPNAENIATVNPVLIEGTEVYPPIYDSSIANDPIGEGQRSKDQSINWWNLSENIDKKEYFIKRNYHMEGYDVQIPSSHTPNAPGMTYKWIGDTYAPILDEDGAADHYYFDRFEQWLLKYKQYHENLYRTKTLTEAQSNAICSSNQLFAPNSETILGPNFEHGIFKPKYLHLDFEPGLTNMMYIDATARWGVLDPTVSVHTIYVSTTGSDSNDGLSLSAPVASFQKAADLAKAYTGTLNVEIRIRGGTYRILEESFYMDETYNLSNGRTLTFKPHNDEEVIISGAYRLNNDEFSLVTESSNPDVWNKLPTEARGNVYEINLCGYDLGVISNFWRGDRFIGTSQLPALPELVFNNKLMTLARWPNKTAEDSTGFEFESCATIENVIESGLDANFNVIRTVDGVFTYPSSYDGVVQNWDVDKGIWLHGFWRWDWQDEVYKVLSIDKVNRRITVNSRNGSYGILRTAPCPGSGDGTYLPTNPTPRRWFAFNFLYGLDSPGEYYIDRETRKMYFWPPSNITSSTNIGFTSRAIAGPGPKKDNSDLEGGRNRFTGRTCRNCDSSIQGQSCCDGVVEEGDCFNENTDCRDRQVGPAGQDLSDDGCEYVYKGWVEDPRIPAAAAGWYQTGGSVHSKTGYNTRRSLASLFKFVNVKNVVIEGLKFADTSGSGIHLHHCKDVKIKKSKFNNIRRRGINAQGGKNITIDGCELTNIGLSAVVLTGGNRQKLIPANHKISNCVIKKFGMYSYIGTHGVNINGVANRIVGNLIENGGTAINPSGNDHIVEYNYIKNIGNYADDWGAIYTGRNMSSRNTTIRNNIFKNCKTLLPGSVSYPCTEGVHTHGNAAIYFDDRESGHNIESNVFYQCGSGKFGAVYFNGGVYHTVKNNMFLECSKATEQAKYTAAEWNGSGTLNSSTQRQASLNIDQEPWYEDGGPLESGTNQVLPATDYSPWTYPTSADGKDVFQLSPVPNTAGGLFNKVDIRKDAYQKKYETIRKQFVFSGTGTSSTFSLNPVEIPNMKNIFESNLLYNTLLPDTTQASNLVGGYTLVNNVNLNTTNFVNYPTLFKLTQQTLDDLSTNNVNFKPIRLDKIQKENYTIPTYQEEVKTPQRIYGSMAGMPLTREMFKRWVSYVKLLRKMTSIVKKIFPTTKVYYYSPVFWNSYQAWSLNGHYPTDGGMWVEKYISPANCQPGSIPFESNCVDPMFEGGVASSCQEAAEYILERVKKSASACTKAIMFVNKPGEEDEIVLHEFMEIFPQLTLEDVTIRDLNYYPNSSVDFMTDNVYTYYSVTSNFNRAGVDPEQFIDKTRKIVENQVNTINAVTTTGQKYGPMIAPTVQGVCGSDANPMFYSSFNGSNTWTQEQWNTNNCDNTNPDGNPCGKREYRDRNWSKYAPKIHMSLPEIYKYSVAPSLKFNPGVLFNWDAFQSYDQGSALIPSTPKDFYDQMRPCQAGEIPCDENCLDYIITGTPDPCNPTTKKFNGCVNCRPLTSISLSGTPRASGSNLNTIVARPYVTPYRISGRRPSDWSRRVSGTALLESGPEFKLKLNPWYSFLNNNGGPGGSSLSQPDYVDYCYYIGRDVKNTPELSSAGLSAYNLTNNLFSRKLIYDLACEFAGYDDLVTIPYKDITNDSYWVGYYGPNGDFDPYISSAGPTTNTNIMQWPWWRRSETSKRIEAQSVVLNIKKHHDLVKYIKNPDQKYRRQWPLKTPKFSVDRRPIFFNTQAVSGGCNKLGQISWGYGSNSDCCNYGFGAFWKKCLNSDNQPITNTGIQKLIEQTLTYTYNLPHGGRFQPELPNRRFMIWVPSGVVYKNQSCSGGLCCDGYTSAITSSMKLRTVEGIDFDNPTGPLKKYVNPSEACWKNITTPVILDAAEHARDPSNLNNQLFIPATPELAESLPLCSSNPSVPCFEPEGRLNEWLTCLGKWIQERPDAEVGLYIGYTIPLDGGVGSGPPKPKPGTMAIQGAAGTGPIGQNVLWAIPDPENNTEHRAFLEAELTPWFNIGIKTLGFDVGYGVANYENGGTIAKDVDRTPVGDYQNWLRSRWPQLKKIYGEAIPYDDVAPVLDEFNKPIPSGRVGGNMPRKSYYSTPVDEVCKGIKVGTENQDNTVFVDNCWKLTDSFGTVHDTKGRERFRKLNPDGADYGPSSIKYSGDAYQYCGYIGLVSGNLDQSWTGPGSRYDPTKPINWYGVDPNQMWCWDKQTTEVVAMFENLGTLSPTVGADWWRVPAWHNGAALPISSTCATPGNGCLSNQPNVIGGKDDGRQYDINSKEYQYVKNEIFQGVKNYVDRGYVVMLGSYASDAPLIKEVRQEILEYIHQNERSTLPYSKDLPDQPALLKSSSLSPFSPLMTTELEVYGLLEEEQIDISTDSSESTNETTNN